MLSFYVDLRLNIYRVIIATKTFITFAVNFLKLTAHCIFVNYMHRIWVTGLCTLLCSLWLFSCNYTKIFHFQAN